MEFESLDGYLLTGAPAKGELVQQLLAQRSSVPGAAPFYEGIARLGERTPDLALLALRLVLVGQSAGDDAVRRLRDVALRARNGDAAARDEYRAIVSAPSA